MQRLHSQNKAREVVKGSAADEPPAGNQIPAEQPASQYPTQVVPANSKAKKAGKAANEADASLLTKPMQNDGIPTMRGATSPTTTQWRALKLGQSGNGIMFKRVGNDAIAFLDETPIAKCVSGSDYQGQQRGYLEHTLKMSKVVISAVSHTGQYVAVFCTSGDPDSTDATYGVHLDAAYGVHLVNLKTKIFFSPIPSKLFQVLDDWISFSPDDRYAVLNQAGDEGDYGRWFWI